MPKYLEDKDLYYEMCISKGKGKLTKKLDRIFPIFAYPIGFVG